MGGLPPLFLVQHPNILWFFCWLYQPPTCPPEYFFRKPDFQNHRIHGKMTCQKVIRLTRLVARWWSRLGCGSSVSVASSTWLVVATGWSLLNQHGWFLTKHPSLLTIKRKKDMQRERERVSGKGYISSDVHRIPLVVGPSLAEMTDLTAMMEVEKKTLWRPKTHSSDPFSTSLSGLLTQWDQDSRWRKAKLKVFWGPKSIFFPKRLYKKLLGIPWQVGEWFFTRPYFSLCEDHPRYPFVKDVCYALHPGQRPTLNGDWRGVKILVYDIGFSDQNALI